MNGGSGFPEGYDVRKTWGSVRPGPDTCGDPGGYGEKKEMVMVSRKGMM